MLLLYTDNVLTWKFDDKNMIYFKVDDWIREGDRRVKTDSVTVSGSSVNVSYDNGGITAEMSFLGHPDTSSLHQTVRIVFHRDVRDFLLDLKFLPVFGRTLDWLTIPGLFYGENNPISDFVIYPKGISRDWSFRADAASCPGIHFAGRDRGYAVFMDNDRMDISINGNPDVTGQVAGIGWISGDGGERSARFTFPCQETPFSYHRNDCLEAPILPRAVFSAGDSVTFKSRHFITPAGKQGYFDPVKLMGEINRPAALEYDKTLLKSTAELFARCLRETHFVPGKGFSHRQDIHEIHTGWCGGFSAVEAGLLYGKLTGDDTLYAQAETMADFICSTALSPAGYFQAEYRDGRWHPHVWWGKAIGLHLRHAAEGSLFLARILLREETEGRRRETWRNALESNLDAALRDQRSDGALPIEVDPETWRALDWQGATPATWAGAFIIGSVLAEKAGDSERAGTYRTAAVKTGEYYLENYVRNDLFFGGPYDAYRAPNMEDPYNLLNSFTELYHHTDDKRFLDAARICADHLLCWRYTYDVIFPEETICRKMNVSTYAMSAASVRNHHIQNWDTVAAISLFELSSWTGDPSYGRSAMDNLLQSCQLVERGDGALGIPVGGQSEQWYATEFFWFGGFGDYGKGNLWKISVVLPKSGFLSAIACLKIN